ncbi:hypothetical protein BH24ACT26_BH24ACT26_02790 [soil metagenome]
MGERGNSAARRAKLRRRRAARVAGIGVGMLAIVGLAFAGSQEKSQEPTGAEAPVEPTLPDGCEQRELDLDPPRRYGAPEAVLRPGRDYRAVLHTSCGDVVLDLFEDEAPENVNSFLFLAQRGFYDGLPWHRVEGDSVIQNGDPNGRNLDPPDGPGYTVDDETASAHFDRYVYGVVGMANAGEDTAGSQFFIVTHDPEGAAEGAGEPAGFRPDYTIIGRVPQSSWDVLERIASVDTRGGIDAVEAVRPVLPVVIDSVDIRAR